MNTWKIIKTAMVKATPGTVGELTEATEAGRVFCLIRKKLTDREEAEADFNSDPLIEKAYSHRSLVNAVSELE